MREFVSTEGERVLSELRVGSWPAVTGEVAPTRLLAAVPSDECGCPEEIWRVDGLDVLIYFEADGKCEMFVFGGDWEDEFTFEGVQNMNALRSRMFYQLAEMEIDNG